MSEFHGDWETQAAIIDMLPLSAQDRWFHRRPREDETQFQRSIFLLDWLEEERKAAVAMHLNNIAKQSQLSAGPQFKPQQKLDSGQSGLPSTDQGLLSGSLLAQQGDSSKSGGR